MRNIIVILLILSGGVSAHTLKSESECLAKAIYWEARGEHVVGKLAVASVVIYRHNSQDFPDTICKVVYQRNKVSKKPEFSPHIIRGSKPTEPEVWDSIQKLSEDIVTGKFRYQLAFTARFFHSTKINPNWKNKTHVATIGGNKFYY